MIPDVTVHGAAPAVVPAATKAKASRAGREHADAAKERIASSTAWSLGAPPEGGGWIDDPGPGRRLPRWIDEYLGAFQGDSEIEATQRELAWRLVSLLPRSPNST